MMPQTKDQTLVSLEEMAKYFDDLGAGRVQPPRAIYGREGDHFWVRMERSPMASVPPSSGMRVRDVAIQVP